VNQKGLDFYKRLLDAMLAQEITPWVTLFHWDLPQALEDRGGWRSRIVPEAFATYVDTAVGALSDRVKNWISLNEIRCFTILGYGKGGDKAPGAVETQRVLNQTYHHALLCHGHAVRAVREYGGRGARVGLTDNSDIPVPVTETEPDIAAARAWFIDRNAHILEPIYTGRYSADYLRRCGADKPQVAQGDFDLIALPTDYLGMNIYTGEFVRKGRKGKYEQLAKPADYPRTTCPWLNIMPQVMYWGTRLAQEVYGVRAIYITESGCGYDNEPVVAGEVHDLHRRDYVRNYLGELRRAIGDGVPVKGYFLWSFMDNLEWQDGSARRFGIVHNDYQTQKRTPKLSAGWYSEVMRTNRLV
jgi:beta-glucosidase